MSLQPQRKKLKTGSANQVLSTSDFAEVVRSPVFVDKTLLMKTILKEPSTILITAPHGFGKTTNMNMMKRFLSIPTNERGFPIYQPLSADYNLFKGNNLKICEDEDFFDTFFGQFPVIHIDWKKVQGNSFEQVFETLKESMHEAFTPFKYFLNIDHVWRWSHSLKKSTFVKYCDPEAHKQLTELEVLTGLKFLSRALYAFHRFKVIVLIDEFDAPIVDSVQKGNSEIGKTVKFIQNLINKSVKNNHCVIRAIFNASTWLAELFLTEPNELSEFYGITESEIKLLLKKDAHKTLKLEDIQSWYKGYKTEDTNKIVYNTFSVVKCLQNKSFENYWLKAYAIPNLENILSLPSIKKEFEKLLNNEEITIKRVGKLEVEHLKILREIFNSPPKCASEHAHLFLQFLYRSGCLDLVEPADDNHLKLRIPNKEILMEFQKILCNSKNK